MNHNISNEGEKHYLYKSLIMNALEDLKKSGMKIRKIDNETIGDVVEYKAINKCIEHIVTIGRYTINDNPISVYLAYSENDRLYENDIYVDGVKHKCYSKGWWEGNYRKESQNNFIVIRLSEHSWFGMKHRINYDGSLFAIIVYEDNKEDAIHKFTYKVDKEVSRKTYKVYDVTCRYKGKSFKFEVGSTKHVNKRLLLLNYKYLDNSSYNELKERIRRFLIKHVKV